MPMTDQEYVAKGGCVCPICGHHDVSGGFVSIDIAVASQDCSCDECGATWTDKYSLTGYKLTE